jgi:hypothetical protein
MESLECDTVNVTFLQHSLKELRRFRLQYTVGGPVSAPNEYHLAPNIVFCIHQRESQRRILCVVFVLTILRGGGWLCRTNVI